MQPAARVSQRTAFFHMGNLVESGATKTLFTSPQDERTQNYITGRIKPLLRSIVEMSDKVAAMLDMVMDAYVNRDLGKAMQAREADQEINDKTDALFRELLTYMMENPRNIEPCTHLLFISKNLERSGDQYCETGALSHYTASL